jgi:methionine sulfoxide reductase heme-binding subunit
MVLVYNALTDNLTANPIQAATQRTGMIAISMLALSLICTPLNSLFHWRIVLPLRRTLGLYAFWYAIVHLFIFAVVDYGLDFELLYGSLLKKPFIYVGLTVFLILLLMAVTSTNGWKKRLGKNWKRLHRLVYIAAPLAGLHFAWALKGDIFKLSGDIFWPVVYLVVISLALITRIPTVKHQFMSRQSKEQQAIVLPPPQK